MPSSARARLVWFRVLLAAGTLLALTMLAQTVISYHYITGNLLLQQGRREGDRIVRQLEEGLRTPPGTGGASLSSSLDGVWRGLSPEAAWIVVVAEQNQILGAARIAETVAANDTASARGICDAVLTSVERFADPAGARDDRTLLVVRFTSECAARSAA